MKLLKAAVTGASVTAILWGLSASVGAAQTTAPVAKDKDAGEIVVTARRSTEKLQNVPLAITAVTADQLSERGITDLQGLAKYTPSLSFKDFVTSFHGNPTIRGMAQINTSNPVSNVGVFVDGVYLQRDYQLNQSLGDYDRIEVVKGPQSALYGANTFAGAINYVTKKPTDEYSANGSATFGNAGEQRFEAGVGGPIVKGVLDGRFYIGSDKYDGTIKNNVPGAVGADKTFGGHDRRAYSAALRYTPTANLTFDAYYSHSTKSEGLRPYYAVFGSYLPDITNCGIPNAVTGRGQLFCGTFATDPSKYRVPGGTQPSGLFANVEPDALGQNDVLRLSAEWEINRAFTAHYTFGATRGSASEDFAFFSNTYNPTLTAISPITGLVVGSGSTGFSQQLEGGQIHYTSHEVRLNYDEGKPYKFELGYFHSDSDDRYFLGLKTIPITGGVIAPLVRYSNSPIYTAAATLFLNNLDQTFAVDAVFGRASYSFLDNRATVSAEFRYTTTKLIYDDIQALIAVPSRPLLSSRYNDPVPRFTGEYKLTPDNLLYVSAAEGIKTGGFNGYVSGTVTLLPSEQSFGEEKNWTYEIGSKNVLFDRKLFLNVDFFYVDWPDKQGSVSPSNFVPNTSAGLVTVANIYQSTGAATNYGIEIDGQYRPIHPLTINFSFTAMNPTYKSGSLNKAFVGYCNAQTCPIDGSIGGNTLERQSPLSGALGAEYRDHFKADWDFFVGGDTTYQSMQYTDQENLGKIAGYALFNARAGLENDKWKVFIWGKNITNKLYVDNVFYTQSQKQYTAAFGERATYGITVSAKF